MSSLRRPVAPAPGASSDSAPTHLGSRDASGFRTIDPTPEREVGPHPTPPRPLEGHRRDQKLVSLLDELWARTLQGNPAALHGLVAWISCQGPRMYRWLDRKVHTREEVFQVVALRILEKARAGTLCPPKENAFDSIGVYAKRLRAEVLRDLSLIQTRRPLQRFRLRLDGTLLHPAGISRERDPSTRNLALPFAPDPDEPPPRSHVFADALERLSDLDRWMIKERLAGKSELQIALALGHSHEAIRQRMARANKRLMVEIEQLRQAG